MIYIIPKSKSQDFSWDLSFMLKSYASCFTSLHTGYSQYPD
jgi:hypothetical protein